MIIGSLLCNFRLTVNHFLDAKEVSMPRHRIECGFSEILTILGVKTNLWFSYGRLVWKHRLLHS